MTQPPDRRMLWQRNIDAVARAKNVYAIEVEVGSELQIPGLLDSGGGVIQFMRTTHQPDPAGLFKYVLRLRQPSGEEAQKMAEGAGREGLSLRGYFVRDGAVGELLSLFSLCLEARFFVLGITLRGLGMHDIPHKQEFIPLRGLAGPHVDRIVFTPREGRNLASSLGPFLDEVSRVPAAHHLDIAVAAEHYARALRTIGVDEEMVFVRLVSAIERLSADEPITDDALLGKNLEDLMRVDALEPAQREELEKTFAVRKSGVRFVSFLRRYSTEFFDGLLREPAHTQITPETLRARAAAIYDARSKYLHNGDPMYVSRPTMQFPDWHMEPTVGMEAQDRLFKEEQKLPTTVFFHGLVRHCLLARMHALIAGPSQAAPESSR